MEKLILTLIVEKLDDVSDGKMEAVCRNYLYKECGVKVVDSDIREVWRGN